MVDFTKFTPDHWHDWFVGASSGINAPYNTQNVSKVGRQGTVVASIISAAAGMVPRPWMAKAVADLVQDQEEIDQLRTLWQEVAKLCGVDKSPALQTVEITARMNLLLKSSEGAEWQLAANGYKPHLKLKGRVVVEALALGQVLYEDVPSHKVVLYPMAFLLSEGFRRAKQSHKSGPIRFPLCIWGFTPQERDKAQNVLWHYHEAQDLAYNSTWSVEEYANQPEPPPEPPPVPDFVHVEPKPKKTKVPAMDTVVEQEAASKLAKLQAAIQDMVKIEVGKALSQSALEALLYTVVAKILVQSPAILKGALANQSTHIVAAIKDNVNAALQAYDVAGMVKGEVTQVVGSKLDTGKLKKELAATLLASSDDYFVTVFDRIVVESTHPTNLGTIIGKLAIKEAFEPKAPKLDSKTTKEA